MIFKANSFIPLPPHVYSTYIGTMLYSTVYNTRGRMAAAAAGSEWEVHKKKTNAKCWAETRLLTNPAPITLELGPGGGGVWLVRLRLDQLDTGASVEKLHKLFSDPVLIVTHWWFAFVLFIDGSKQVQVVGKIIFCQFTIISNNKIDRYLDYWKMILNDGFKRLELKEVWIILTL